jgi:putative ABC transport system substrate-binding protein
VTSRRTFLTALAGGMLAMVAPAVEAETPAKMALIGLLSPFSTSDSAAWHQAFRLGLHDLGWVEGKNLRIEYRYASGSDDRLPALIADLIRLKVDVIVTSVTLDAVAAKKATSTIPIVMAAVGDPVVTGIVPSIRRPGGNITGLSQRNPELMGKRLELLRQAVPMLSQVAVLWNPEDPINVSSWKEIQVAAREQRIQLHSLEVRTPSDFAKAFEDAGRARAGALVIMPSPVFVTNMRRLADLAAIRRLPSIFHLREFVNAGGLMAYGPDRADLFRRAAGYVDKILKGAKAGDLPIEQPNKFELVINFKTAKALGLKIPQSLLLQADQVIE